MSAGTLLGNPIGGQVFSAIGTSENIALSFPQYGLNLDPTKNTYLQLISAKVYNVFYNIRNDNGINSTPFTLELIGELPQEWTLTPGCYAITDLNDSIGAACVDVPGMVANGVPKVQLIVYRQTKKAEFIIGGNFRFTINETLASMLGFDQTVFENNGALDGPDVSFQGDRMVDMNPYSEYHFFTDASIPRSSYTGNHVDSSFWQCTNNEPYGNMTVLVPEYDLLIKLNKNSYSELKFWIRDKFNNPLSNPDLEIVLKFLVIVEDKLMK